MIGEVLSEAGRQDDFARESAGLGRDLVGHRWLLDRAAFELAAADVMRFTGTLPAPRYRHARSAAAGWAYAESRQLPSSGRRIARLTRTASTCAGRSRACRPSPCAWLAWGAGDGAFKTPTLREIARTAPYMHDGSVQSLEEVVEFYDRGGQPNPHLDAEIRPATALTRRRAHTAGNRRVGERRPPQPRRFVVSEPRATDPSASADSSRSLATCPAGPTGAFFDAPGTTKRRCASPARRRQRS